jgi:hypothetical protein
MTTKKAGHLGWRARLSMGRDPERSKGESRSGQCFPGDLQGNGQSLWKHKDLGEQQGTLSTGGDTESDPTEEQKAAKKPLETEQPVQAQRRPAARNSQLVELADGPSFRLWAGKGPWVPAVSRTLTGFLKEVGVEQAMTSPCTQSCTSLLKQGGRNGPAPFPTIPLEKTLLRSPAPRRAGAYCGSQGVLSSTVPTT